MKALFLFGLMLGAWGTSYAEYRFKYNLYDFTKDIVKKVGKFFNF